ncbi:hypothetical protein LCGC14_0634510 [marine sediment metagenome]|uniref:Uncharacterized protein n=1 Tax=marine sediment metagenome TaxID=412755 RepID=A0A0F9R6A0_9ZZZZ
MSSDTTYSKSQIGTDQTSINFFDEKDLIYKETPQNIPTYLINDEDIFQSTRISEDYLRKIKEFISLIGDSQEINEQRPISLESTISYLSEKLISRFIDKKLFLSKNYRILKNEINRSRYHVLNLKDNWDGEGSKGFNLVVWKEASSFLLRLFHKFYTKYGIIFDVPTILPVEDFSIDIHWKTDKMELTINFSEEFYNFPSFYGRDNEGNEIQGTIEKDKIHIIIFPWLKSFY